MRVYTNNELIEHRVTWAKRISTIGLVALLVGLVVNLMSFNDPSLANPALILLVIGLIAAVVSSHLANNWMKDPRADQFLEKQLKKFNNDYQLFNYTIFTANILLTPQKLYPIVVRNQEGEMAVKGNRISRKFTWRRLLRLFNADSIGRPADEAERLADRLRNLLLDEGLDEAELPPIQPLVIFSNEEANLVIAQEPPVPVLHSKEIRTYLREEQGGPTLPKPLRSKIAQIIGGDHIKNKKRR